MNSFISQNKLYIWSFLLILVQTIFGLIYSNVSYSIDFTTYSVTLIFFLINHLIELYLAPFPRRKIPISLKFIALLDITIFLTLIYFIMSDSLQAALLPLAYSILIHIQYFFIYYKLEKIGTLTTSLFKALLIPVITYYIQNQFITYSLIIYSIPFTFFIFILESFKFKYLIHDEQNPLFSNSVIIKLYLPLSFLISGIIAWRAVQWWALLLIIPYFVSKKRFTTALIYSPLDIEHAIYSIFKVYFSFSFFYLLIFFTGL